MYYNFALVFFSNGKSSLIRNSSINLARMQHTMLSWYLPQGYRNLTVTPSLIRPRIWFIYSDQPIN